MNLSRTKNQEATVARAKKTPSHSDDNFIFITGRFHFSPIETDDIASRNPLFLFEVSVTRSVTPPRPASFFFPCLRSRFYEFARGRTYTRARREPVNRRTNAISHTANIELTLAISLPSLDSSSFVVITRFAVLFNLHPPTRTRDYSVQTHKST